jgi:hypothetical protein
MSCINQPLANTRHLRAPGLPHTPPMPQLDLFTDAQDTIRVNAVADALLSGDVAAAGSAIEALAYHDAAHALLPQARALLAELQARRDDLPLDSAASLRDTRAALDGQLAAAAVALMGADAARGWLQARRRALAGRAAHLPWQPGQPETHAAGLLADAKAWALLRSSVERIDAWRQQPVPLAWAVQAAVSLDGTDASWPLLAELCWLAPERAAATLGALAEPRLVRWRDRFDADLDGESLAWWPAWLLVDQPALQQALGPATLPQPDQPAQQAYQLVRSLLHLERQGRQHEIAEQRRRLQSLHAALFAAYLRPR